METPAPAAAPASALERADALVQNPQAQAIAAAIEDAVAKAINGLPKSGTPGTPGWKTSEFWTLIVFWLLSTLTMVAGSLPPKWAVLADAAVAGLYTISRGLTKHGNGN